LDSGVLADAPTRAACKRHITDELTGVKKLIEAGDYDARDIIYALEDEELMSKVKRYGQPV
jgi:hypothetical protein